jgi:hypothetical protein
MSNPLKQYFRQPAIYLTLPTLRKWYKDNEVTANESGEIPIYGLTAVDDIMLNTPDALLNGQALENVIKNCVPDIKKIKKIMVPDIEAIFLGIKIGTSGGTYDVEKVCPKCQFENTFEVNCEYLIGTMTCIEDNDCKITIDNDLEINVKPYTLEMRQLFIHRQFEEDRLIKSLANKNLSEFEQARILGESIEKISRMTFDLVSRSIESVRLIKQNINVTDHANISEWLVNIPKKQADIVIEKVNNLNEIGVNKKVQVNCQNCAHSWEDTLNFDPSSFFAKR